MFTKPPAFREINHEPLREKTFGPAVGRPLELLVALIHVFEKIFHPEQSVLSIRHGGRFLGWGGLRRHQPGGAEVLISAASFDQQDRVHRDSQDKRLKRDASYVRVLRLPIL